MFLKPIDKVNRTLSMSPFEENCFYGEVEHVFDLTIKGRKVCGDSMPQYNFDGKCKTKAFVDF